jgi:PAS domain S-box-containing protein
MIVVRDLTELRSAQREIEESDRRYRELVDNSQDLICTHDLGGRILSVNPAASRLLDIPQDELLRSNIRDILIPEARGEFDEYIASLTSTGTCEGKMRVRTRQGQVRIWEFRNVLQSEGGEAVVRGLAHDVTARDEALASLRRSETLFRTIIEASSDLIGIIDGDGVIRYHSPSVTQTVGCRPDHLVGRELAELVHPEDTEAMRAAVQHLVNHPNASRTISVRVRCGEAWRFFEIALKNVLRADRVESIVVNARDVTERRALEAQLAQTQRLTSLGRLAAIVAHEFNNVLMGMLPFAELLQRSGLSQAARVKSAQHIVSSIGRGKRVALDILRFTQPAAPTMKVIELASWWSRLLPELQAQTGNHIELTWNFEAGTHVTADPAQLDQVFANLLSNALDAMPKQGKLTVTARVPRNEETFSFGIVPEPSRFALISVRDTGSGISADVIGHVFEPLVTTKENGGTGLGLAVVHQVVMRHEGHIFVESEVGQGTVFHIFLPLASRPAQMAREQPRSPAAFRARRLLFVEDETAITEGLTEMLADDGVIVHAVETGGVAMDAIERHNPDAVVVDLRLPDMDGGVLGACIRAAHPLLPIIYASGHRDQRDIPLDALSRFLQKPYAVDDLASALVDLEKAQLGGSR